MHITYLLANAADLKVHPVVRAAYEALLALGELPVTGMGAYAVRSGITEAGLFVVSGFGWLHLTADHVPILELPSDFAANKIEALAWREVASCLAVLRTTSTERADLLRMIAAGCPRDSLGLMGIPASRDLTPLRRKLKLRPSDMEQPAQPSIFEQARAKAALR